MAPRVSDAFANVQSSCALEVLAGRVVGYRSAGRSVEVTLRLRGGAMREFKAGHVINCTGPGGDFANTAIPLIAELRDRQLAVPDALGVGVETDDCAVIGGTGEASSWLFALGPLTRPAWWEITAVPGIKLQIERALGQISRPLNGPSLAVHGILGIGW